MLPDVRSTRLPTTATRGRCGRGSDERSIGAQRALGKRVKAPAEVQATLMTLIDRVARRLRAARRACRTVVLRLRFDDFSRATRSHTMTQATTRTATLLRVARGLLTSAQPMIFLRGLTLIGVALTNLCDEHAIQLALPFDRVAELDRVIDTLRERYGSSAVSARRARRSRRRAVGAAVTRLAPLSAD